MTTPQEYLDFLQTLDLQAVQPASLVSERLGDISTDVPDVQMTWNQAYADGDPVLSEPEVAVFRPKFEMVVSQKGVVLFRQESKIMVVFKLKDPAGFHRLWSSEAVRDIFLRQQIQKTLWPLFRQHVHDGMSRLGMQPVALPFLM